MIKTVRATVEAIDENAWRRIDYPDDGEAQIAETVYAARRLIVRRTRLVGAQAQLWPAWAALLFDQRPAKAVQARGPSRTRAPSPCRMLRAPGPGAFGALPVGGTITHGLPPGSRVTTRAFLRYALDAVREQRVDVGQHLAEAARLAATGIGCSSLLIENVVLTSSSRATCLEQLS